MHTDTSGKLAALDKRTGVKPGLFCLFGCRLRGILALQHGIEPAPPALEGEVLPTGPPEKFPSGRHFNPPAPLSPRLR